jgi:hypothetical protein
MATRSRIAIENEDGTVSSIYCHWDGYPSNNGRILVDHYKDREKVKALIALGSISSLDEEVSSADVSHSFVNPASGVTVAYHRDRGEDYDPPRVDENREEYFSGDNEEYGYIFTLEGEWLVKPTYGDRDVQPVNEVLANES